MTTRFPDFNPANRNPAQFGYSPVRDALYRVWHTLRLTSILTPALSYPRVIDSSHWTIENIKDYKQVAETIVLFYTKSTEGNYYTDAASQAGALQAKAAGMITLFFHFIRRNIDGKSQFNYFKSKTAALIAQIGGQKIVIIDMETVDGVSNLVGNGNFKGFANDAHADGYKVGLYVNPAQWVSFGLGAWVNAYIDFYILAHWKPGNNPDKPPGIDFAKIAMQQEGVLGLHSWIQPIPGLVEQMDANLLLWLLAQWETFTGQKYSPGNPIPPPDPDPTPTGDEPIMQFINTGGDISNIRAAPIVSTTNLIGKLPDGAIVTALELDFVAGYAWVKYAVTPAWLLPGKTALVGWSALIAISGNALIDFHAAVPCPGENEMYVTLEEMTAAIAEALTSLVTNPPTTHKVITTAPNGVKLRAYPGGSEAAMLANNTQVRLLIDKTWNEHKLYAAFIGNVWVSGWMKSEEVVSL